MSVPGVEVPGARVRLGGLLLMAALALAWGLNWPATKVSVSEIPPLLLRSFTLSTGGMGLLLLARGLGYSLRIERGDLVPLVRMALFTVTGWQVCMAYGVYLMPATRASIIGNTTPIWVAVLGVWLLRERLTVFTVAGIAAGASGLALLIGPEMAVIRTAPLGALLMLVAAISVAGGAVCMKLHEWKTPISVLTGWGVLLGGVPVYAAALLAGQSPAYPLSGPALFATAYNVVVATLFAQWAWFKIVTLFPVAIASITGFAIPVVAVFSSAWLLDESLGRSELGALALVLVGLFSVLFGPGALRSSAP